MGTGGQWIPAIVTMNQSGQWLVTHSGEIIFKDNKENRKTMKGDPGNQWRKS